MLASSLRGFPGFAGALEFAARARSAAEELVMRRACPMNMDGGVGIACLRPVVSAKGVELAAFAWQGVAEGLKSPLEIPTLSQMIRYVFTTRPQDR